MSKKLLLSLNGNNNGAFRGWLDNFNGEPKIAWYPSAGKDFRDLLYLHPAYPKINPASKPEPQCPDIFLHTDYYPWSHSTFLDSPTLYKSPRITVTAKSIEELPLCELPLDDKIVDFPKGGSKNGRVLFLEIEVFSAVLGTFSVPLIYAFVENAAFCAQRILPHNGRLSHIINVCFGGGCGGGGKSTGIWLLNILQKVHCEAYISDRRDLSMASGDKRIYDLYPALSGNKDESQFEQIRTIGHGWGYHRSVFWNIVKPPRELDETAIFNGARGYRYED